MASLYLLKPTFSPSFSILQSNNFPRKTDSKTITFRLRSYGDRSSRRCLERRRSWVCSVKEDDNQSNGEEPAESLFMKELKRRGMTSDSLYKDTGQGNYGVQDEMKLGEEDRAFSKRNVISTELDKSLANQRERSMALNSEGLEGLIPRAKLLLTIGGTFFLAFWPLIIVIVGFSSALYIFFGPSFVHDASQTSISPPQYSDPHTLLEDERISQISPDLK